MRTYTVALIALLIVGIAVGCASKKKTSMKIYVQQELYDKAILNGEQELLVSPEDGDTHYFLGAAYFGKDHKLKPESESYADSSAEYLEKAFHHFTKSKQYAESSWGKDADDNIVSMFGRHYNRGVIATKKSDHATAALEYRLATIADPENYQGYYARAGSLWFLAKDAQKRGDDAEFEEITAAIVKDLDRVIELEPEEKETTIAVHQTKGDVLYKRGDLEGAQAAYKRAVQLDPENYSLMVTMAERFYNEQDWDNAVGYFQDALSVKGRLNLIEPDDSAAYSALGNALSKLDRRDEAIVAYHKALELTPNDAAVLYNIMVNHYKQGDKAEKDGDVPAAKQHYNQAIEIGNELIGMDAKRPEYWQVRGLCKRGVGDFAGAARDLKEFQDLRGGSGGR
ncbi:MAG: tetratricopeptide repeat protein [Candidatus Krumholzibacteriia bacterium]